MRFYDFYVATTPTAPETWRLIYNGVTMSGWPIHSRQDLTEFLDAVEAYNRLPPTEAGDLEVTLMAPSGAGLVINFGKVETYEGDKLVSISPPQATIYLKIPGLPPDGDHELKYAPKAHLPDDITVFGPCGGEGGDVRVSRLLPLPVARRVIEEFYETGLLPDLNQPVQP